MDGSRRPDHGFIQPLAERLVRHAASGLLSGCRAGSVETVQTLLEQKQKLDMRNGQGLTALMLAASKGHLKLVDLLLARGAKVNALASDWTPTGQDCTDVCGRSRSCRCTR